MDFSRVTELRNELDQIDRDIMELIARRQSTVREIGKTKRELHGTLRDFGRERVVFQKWRDAAAQFGLPEELADTVVATLIEHSLTAQEVDKVNATTHGNGRQALVIGGGGRMGAWFANFLAEQNFDVSISDPSSSDSRFPRVEDWRDACRSQRLIVVATPMQAAKTILTQLADIKPPGLIFDLASVKSPLREPLERLASEGLRVTSIHPMFGPNAQLLSGRHVLFVDLGVPAATAEARRLFDATMADQIEVRLDEHDKLAACVLGLSHAVNLILVNALERCSAHMPGLENISSSTFDAQLRIAANVSRENPEVYFEIQHLNDFSSDALRSLEEATLQFISTVRAGDSGQFIDQMKAGQKFLERIGRS